jgi:hypothetical protein
VTEQSELLLTMTRRLAAAGIPYMVTGSYGSAMNGFPRATNDIDIIIDPSREALERFIESFGDPYYVSRDAALSAFQRRSLFNVIDTSTGWKVDLIVRKTDPFGTSEFNRRRKVLFEGDEVDAISPEDSILSKLDWAKKGESDRQLRDAESVAVVNWRQLDLDYLRHWAVELGVQHELEMTLDRAAQLHGSSSLHPPSE